MTFRHIPMTLLAAIAWMSQTPSSKAQGCADAIKIPYRAPICDGQSSERAVRIASSEAFANAISMPYFIHSSRPELGRVGVTVVVTPNGTVVGVTPVSGDPQWYERATALAMTWRFKAFVSHGNAVYTTFSSALQIVPPERRPEGYRPFPDIKNWDSLRITLQRTACRGSCPAYTLTAFGDGSVLYHGDNEWADSSERGHRGHISPDVVQQLVRLFRSADYFNLFDRYGRAYDAPDFITSISFDGNSKSVVDEVGSDDGMPDIVRWLENEIDRLAGSKVWQADN